MRGAMQGATGGHVAMRFMPDRVGQVLAALQAHPPIAAALMQAQVGGNDDEVHHRAAQLGEITSVLDAHGEIVQAIESIAARHRCAVGDLCTEELADLWRHP